MHYYNVKAPLLAWTKFRILTCKCLTLLQHLDPPLVLLSLLALVALCPLYLLYLLFLSHSHLQMRMASRAPSDARMGTLSTLLLVALNQQDLFIS